MIEFLLQLLFEFLLQAFGELLMELGLHAMKEPFQDPPTPSIAAIGYLLIGLLVGGLSLLIFHQHFIQAPLGRWLNLLLTPVLAGLAMAQIGAWRARRGQRVLRIDRFAYGYLFALGFALIRFTFAR